MVVLSVFNRNVEYSKWKDVFASVSLSHWWRPMVLFYFWTDLKVLLEKKKRETFAAFISNNECLDIGKNLYQPVSHLFWVMAEFSENISIVLILGCLAGSLANRDVPALRRCDAAQFESVWIFQTSSLAYNGDLFSLYTCCVFGGNGVS